MFQWWSAGDKGTTVENIYDDLGNRIETRTSLGSVVQKAHLEEELGITFRAFGAGWRYDWQSDGMLSRVVRPDSKEVSFAYDALGRRTEKTYEGVTTHFVWDGNVPLHEWQEVAADAGKADVTTWLFEQNTFIPAAKLAANGESFSIVSDYLGTPMQAFDNNGNKVWEQELDIFGRKKKEGQRIIPPSFRLSIKVSMRTLRRGCTTTASAIMIHVRVITSARTL